MNNLNVIKKRKVVLVGCGFVGMSFIYSAMNQSLFDEYVLIDVIQDNAKGNALDTSDAIAWLPLSTEIVRYGDYSECDDADIVVITAGVNQKPGETRLDLVEKNTKIMVDISEQIKKTKFAGISVIASNPVDILTNVYQTVTNFPKTKVLGTGTSLDSARLIRLVADRLKLNTKNVNAYVIGEHGDSSVSLLSSITISGIPLRKYISEKDLSDDELKQMHKDVVDMAYKIINCKKATYYGIGSCIAHICKAILRNSNLILPISVINEYSSGMYSGFLALVNSSGWVKPVYPLMTKDEETRFKSSCDQMKNIYLETMKKFNY